MDREPTYAFTIPSISDELPLDCRIYVPEANLLDDDFAFKGAVVAHPYAPLGGSFDDAVVLNVTHTLLKLGFTVTTFNFRGAGMSAGKTSWTGRSEIDDYATVVALTIYHLQHIRQHIDLPAVSQSVAMDQHEQIRDRVEPIRVVLCGYSFGSLVLARLPPIASILDRIEAAERGSPAIETFLRGRTLAKQTRGMVEAKAAESAHITADQDSSSPTRMSSSGTIMSGGGDTPTRKRRRTRDSRISIDLSVRDISHRIKNTIRRGSDTSQNTKGDQPSLLADQRGRPHIVASYLMISPVLLPMTTTLAPLGFTPTSILSFTHTASTADRDFSGFYSLSSRSLIVFGDSDNFTSAKRLQQWAGKLATESSGLLEWKEITRAGHFWHGKGVMKSLQESITVWTSANLELG